MINVPHSILLVFIAGAVTFFLRAVPFLLFGGKKEMPAKFQAVADKLPPAIIAVLVIYCAKDAFSSVGTSTLATIIALAAVVGLHLWKRNTLLSVFAGTVIYMICIRIM